MRYSNRIISILLLSLTGLAGCKTQPAPQNTCPSEQVRDWIDFQTASTILTPEAEQVLDAQARWLRCYVGMPVTITGFANEKPNKAENNILAQRRALAARAYLASRGIAPMRITTVACGVMQGSGHCHAHENVSGQSALMTIE